jgi:hypothetical protein
MFNGLNLRLQIFNKGVIKGHDGIALSTLGYRHLYRQKDATPRDIAGLSKTIKKAKTLILQDF